MCGSKVGDNISFCMYTVGVRVSVLTKIMGYGMTWLIGWSRCDWLFMHKPIISITIIEYVIVWCKVWTCSWSSWRAIYIGTKLHVTAWQHIIIIHLTYSEMVYGSYGMRIWWIFCTRITITIMYLALKQPFIDEEVAGIYCIKELWQMEFGYTCLWLSTDR